MRTDARPLRSWFAATLVAAGALLLATPAGAATRVPCAKHAGELGRSFGAAIWVERGTLYGCAPAVRSRYTNLRATARPRVKIGRWTPGSRAALRIVDVAWTQRTRTPSGAIRDRVWAFDLRHGRTWLRDLDPVGALSSAAVDQRIVALKVHQDVAFWVTAGGRLLLSARASDEELNDFGVGGTLLGEGSPAATGLTPFAELKEVDHRVFAGSWPGQVDALRHTLRVGDGEVIGDVETVCLETVSEVTVRPIAGARRVGVTWTGISDDTEPDCIRPSVPSGRRGA